MKKIILPLICIVTFMNAHAQPGFQWVKNLGETTQSTVFSKSTAIDAAGNVYTAGYMKNGTADFDPGLPYLISVRPIIAMMFLFQNLMLPAIFYGHLKLVEISVIRANL